MARVGASERPSVLTPHYVTIQPADATTWTSVQQSLCQHHVLAGIAPPCLTAWVSPWASATSKTWCILEPMLCSVRPSNFSSMPSALFPAPSHCLQRLALPSSFCGANPFLNHPAPFHKHTSAQVPALACKGHFVFSISSRHLET